MSGVAQPSASVGLYNELIHLPVEDTARAGQIEWALRSIARQAPTDVATSVALIQAATQQGKAAEALAEADRAWAMQSRASGDVLATFQAQLIGLGEYERADHVANLLQPGVVSAVEKGTRERITACNLGDVARIGAVTGTDPTWASLLGRLEREGFATHFPARQTIVREKLRGRQVVTTVLLTQGDEHADASPELAQQSFVAGDFAARTAIEDELYSELEVFCAGRNLDAALFWELVMPMIMPLAARPTFQVP